MSNTVWLQTPSALINMSNLDIIGFDAVSSLTEVNISIWINGQTTAVPIATLKSQKAALKYMSVLSKLIKSNAKCIDSNLIAEQCNNDDTEQGIG